MKSNRPFETPTGRYCTDSEGCCCTEHFSFNDGWQGMCDKFRKKLLHEYNEEKHFFHIIRCQKCIETFK